MKEKLTGFEVAKIAKVKGFDWGTNLGYLETYPHITEHELSHNFNIAAPTQSFLQKWLRDVHNIDISVMIRFADTYGVTIHKNRNIPKEYEEIIIKVTYENHKNLYEETLEVGLLEALKLI
jgi:hypothetical protein